jgi:hypothetical protein
MSLGLLLLSHLISEITKRGADKVVTHEQAGRTHYLTPRT